MKNFKIAKRIIALAMVMVMVCGMFAGCQSSGSGSDDPVTITVFSELANFSGEQGGWSGQMLLEKFNVILNIIPSTEGVYETRMEDGFLGDIVVFGSDGENYTRALEAGMLYDWNYDDLLQEYGPYIYENMQAALDKNGKLTQKVTATYDDDGNVVEEGDYIVYGFGHNVSGSSEDHEDFFYTWDVRWDLYKELGYPEIKNMDDMLQLFIDMKEICPTDDNGNETYAVSLWPDWDGDMVMYVKAFATSYWGYDEHGIGLYDVETGDYHDALEENGPYLQALKFFNQLYQNDLLDPNSMSQTYDNMYEKVQAGGVLFSIFNYSGSLGYNSDEHLNEDKYMGSLVASEASPIVYGMSTTGGNRIWAIGSDTANPELCMEIINWLCTPEGVMTYNYGPEGLCWYYDEEGYTHLTEFGELCRADRSTQMIGDYEGTGDFNSGCIQINNSTWSINAVNPDSTVGESFSYDHWKSTQEADVTAIEQDWRDVTGTSSVQEYMENQDYSVAVSTTFTIASKDGDFKTTWSAVTDIIVTYSWRAIYAENDEQFEQIVSEMITQAKAYGYDECVTWSVEQAEIRHDLEEAVRALSE